MPFSKGDPNINRKGRPKNAEPELLREALKKEGLKRGMDFWEKVASYAFTDKNVMIAVLKKFVPDISHVDGEGFGNTTVNVDNQKRVFIFKDAIPDDNEDDRPLYAEEGAEGTRLE